MGDLDHSSSRAREARDPASFAFAQSYRPSVPTTHLTRALLIHRYLFRLALAAGNFFGWIVVFRVLYFFSADISLALAGTALLFALGQGISFVLTPLAGAALRHGVRRALVFGSLAAVVSFFFLVELFLSRLSFSPDVAFSLVAGFVVMSGIQRALYFVPYATASALTESRARHVLVREASLALVPLVGGYVIHTVAGGTGLVFATAGALALASAIALVEMPEVYERFEWRFGETLSALFAHSHRGALAVAIFDGLQGAALLLIWPLAAFLILGQSFFLFGVVMSATFLIAFIGRFFIRRVLRRFRAERSPYVLATIAFSSWIVRLAAGTPVQIIVADLYYHSGAQPRGRGVDVHAFDQWADNGHYVDEFTALKEMGFCLGRIFMCVLFAALAFNFVPAVAFAACIAIAAVAAATSVMLSHRLSRQAF